VRKPTSDPLFHAVFNRATAGRWLIGASLLAALLIGVEYHVGWGALLAPWQAFPLPWLALLWLLTGLSYVLRAVRVYDYSHALLRGAFSATLRLSVVHNTLNNFLPMRLGELAYPLLMKRYFGQGYATSGATLLWIRLLDLHFLGLLALLVLHASAWQPLWLGLSAAWLGLLPLLYWTPTRLLARLPARPGRMARIAGKILQQVPDNGWKFFRIWLWTALSWSLKLLAYSVVVLHFAAIDGWRALLGTIGAELSSVLPVHGIAGSGSYELAMAAVLIPLGLEMASVLKAAVNLHLYLLGSNLLFGIAALLLPKPMPPEA
jgi:uncharacterized membrane protein YbhN (UPF0104 family)